jgi:alpha-galactosidase
MKPSPCLTFVEAWCRRILEKEDNRVSVRGLKQSWGILQMGRSFEGGVLCINKQQYGHGLGTHADSVILVQSEEVLSRFGAIVGYDQNRQTLGAETVSARLIFSVEVHGVELWRSGEMTPKSFGASFELLLPPETKEIVLKAWSVNGDLHRAHADWASPWVELASGDKVKLGESPYPSVPFSFVYHGKASRELLPAWEREKSSRKDDKTGITHHTITWRDSQTALECRMELREFTDFPAVEWNLYFKNCGKWETPILKDIQAIDVNWNIRRTERTCVGIYRSLGAMARNSDFEYVTDKLFANESIRMNAGEGRSSQNWLPFFNVDLGDLGIVTAIGWSGQWACELEHIDADRLHIQAGMEKTHLKLFPGEEIRSPLIAQLFWRDDRMEGHNLFRRFVLRHHSPRVEGETITGPFTIGHWGGMSSDAQLDRIKVYKREKLPQEYLWMDAGWYGLNSTFSPDEFLGDWARHTGDWRVNSKAHPKGLRPIADAARDAGMKFMLWVEPERAVSGTHWPTQHPDWFLGEGQNLLLNLGKPEALADCIELLSNLIRENDVSIYREDFNMDPLSYWRENDPPDRQGITEIRWMEGFYAFWDALLLRHPGLIIDNCASGGRRIDLETVSRSIALWRSDTQCHPHHDPADTQAQGMGLSYWLPLHGAGLWGALPSKEFCSTYRVRSTMGPAMQLSSFVRETYPIQDNYPWEWFRKMCQEYLRARPFYVGDYYPLIEPVSASLDQWAVYQMDRPDLAQGMIMAFRRKEAPWETGTFRLKALDSEALYEIENADTNIIEANVGEKLASGLEISLPTPETSALFFYRKR